MSGPATRNKPDRPSLGRLLRLTRKELRETLRDRRTVITLVLMPLLVYPLLSISFNKYLLLTSEQTGQPGYVIGVETNEDLAVLQRLLVDGGKLLRAKQQQTMESATEPAGVEVSPTRVDEDMIELLSLDGSKLENHVANLDVHVAVRITGRQPEAERRRRPRPVECELIYRESSAASQQAMRFIEERLQIYNEASLRGRLAALRAPSGVPAEMTFKPISTGVAAPFSLATLVPLVLILMTITGSVYPAIDLTAGERERRTMETLIAAPISRMALLIAKYAAVLTVAVLTAMVNLLAMTVTILTSSLGSQLFPEGFPPLLMVQIFGLMILFAAFFSAIVLALTSFARSFKEAQAYLIPVMLLAISPGLLSLMPGLELSGTLAVAPLVNIVLLSRDILEGTAEASTVFLAIASTGVYAIAAIAIASRIFGNDALLYASRGSWSELFERPIEPTSSATPAATLACLATLFPAFFVLAHLAQSIGGDNMLMLLLLNSFVTIAVFGLWPLLFAVAQRVMIVPGFRLNPPAVLAVVGSLIMGLGIWPLAYELYLFGEWVGLVSLDRNQFEMAERLLTEFRGLPVPVLLLTLAVIPAALEEFFFRGYLFQGLRGRFHGPLIIVVTALLFGLFHVLSPSALMPERFLPSSLLGIVLGWVCYRSGSVLPGMLLHACHNGLLLIMVQYQDQLQARGWDLEHSAHIPWPWLLCLLAVALFGAAVVYWGTRRGSRKK